MNQPVKTTQDEVVSEVESESHAKTKLQLALEVI
jgi:hypothetical protein